MKIQWNKAKALHFHPDPNQAGYLAAVGLANGGTQIGQRDHARTEQGSNLTDIQFQFLDVLVQIWVMIYNLVPF